MRTRSLLLATGLMLSLLVGPVAGQTKTTLSTKADTIKTGMTHAQVLAILGPPTWAITRTDTGSYALPAPEIRVELRWRNAPCFHVAMTFNDAMRVTGMDAGRVCAGTYQPPDPSKAALCAGGTRRALCYGT